MKWLVRDNLSISNENKLTTAANNDNRSIHQVVVEIDEFLLSGMAINETKDISFFSLRNRHGAQVGTHFFVSYDTKEVHETMARLQCGLVNGHAYSFIHAVEVDGVRLVCCRRTEPLDGSSKLMVELMMVVASLVKQFQAQSDSPISTSKKQLQWMILRDLTLAGTLGATEQNGTARGPMRAKNGKRTPKSPRLLAMQIRMMAK